MTIDLDSFKEILTRYEDRVAEFYRTESRPAGARAEKPAKQNVCTFHALGIKRSSMSNHRQLLRDVFLREINDDIQDLDIFLRHSFPVLNNIYLSFELESFPAKTTGRGAKFRLSICNSGSQDSAVLLKTAAARVETLHQRIGHLPRGDKEFLVNQLHIPAANPKDALRVALALHRPDLFEGPEKYDSNFTVSEIHPVSIEDALS